LPGNSCEIIAPRPPPVNEAIEMCGKMVHTPIIMSIIGHSLSGILSRCA